jgi:hypothetical protein
MALIVPDDPKVRWDGFSVVCEACSHLSSDVPKYLGAVHDQRDLQEKLNQYNHVTTSLVAAEKVMKALHLRALYARNPAELFQKNLEMLNNMFGVAVDADLPVNYDKAVAHVKTVNESLKQLNFLVSTLFYNERRSRQEQVTAAKIGAVGIPLIFPSTTLTSTWSTKPVPRSENLSDPPLQNEDLSTMPYLSKLIQQGIRSAGKIPRPIFLLGVASVPLALPVACGANCLLPLTARHGSRECNEGSLVNDHDPW